MFTIILRFFGLMKISEAREINEEIAAADFRTMKRYLSEDAPHLKMRSIAEREHREWANNTFDQVIKSWKEQDYIVTEFEAQLSKIK